MAEMKKIDKIFSLPLIMISGSFIIYFLLTSHPVQTYTQKSNFLYKDGLFYKKDGGELFTGRIIDTAEVIIDFEVSKGRKDGKFTTYFLEGGIEKEGMIIKNNNEGIWKYYYETGQIETIGIFTKNLPNGEWVSYYKNGETKVRGYYRDGLQIGCWSYYDQYGNLINTVSYIDNVLQEKTLMNI